MTTEVIPREMVKDVLTGAMVEPPAWWTGEDETAWEEV